MQKIFGIIIQGTHPIYFQNGFFEITVCSSHATSIFKATPRVPEYIMVEALSKSVNSNPDPAIVFLPHVTMHFIEFDDLGGMSPDLDLFFPKTFHPLADRHKTKAKDMAN